LSILRERGWILGVNHDCVNYLVIDRAKAVIWRVNHDCVNYLVIDRAKTVNNSHGALKLDPICFVCYNVFFEHLFNLFWQNCHSCRLKILFKYEILSLSFSFQFKKGPKQQGMKRKNNSARNAYILNVH